VSCVVKGTALPHDPAVCLLSDIHPKNNLLHTGALRQEGKGGLFISYRFNAVALSYFRLEMEI